MKQRAHDGRHVEQTTANMFRWPACEIVMTRLTSDQTLANLPGQLGGHCFGGS